MSDDECPHGLGDPAWCKICKDGPSRPHKPEVAGSPFPAMFEANCRNCNDTITQGELIVRMSDQTYVHFTTLCRP